MESLKLKLVSLSVGGFALFGCAHSAVDTRLDQRLSQEGNIRNISELQSEVANAIDTAKGLNDQQRSQLKELRQKTRGELDQMRNDSFKLRMLLVEDVISTHYDSDEVDLIKKRLQKLEDQRLSVIFSAVEKANTILGRDAANHQKIVRHFLIDQQVRLN